MATPDTTSTACMEAENDLPVIEADYSSDDHNMAADIPSGGRETTEKRQLEQQQASNSDGGGRGNLFAKLFRRGRNKEPAIANGAADLLDDDEGPSPPHEEDEEGGETATHDESCAESSDAGDGESLDNENNKDESEEEEEFEQEEETDGESDNEEESSSSQSSQDRAETQQQVERGEFDEFGDFAQAPKFHDNNEEEGGDEMMSLIGSGEPKDGTKHNENGLGASLSKFFDVKPKKQEQKERRGLLLAGNDTDGEEDNDNSSDGADGVQPQQHGFMGERSENDDYFDTQERDGFENEYQDDKSEPGEYRLENFYPSDSCRQDNPEQAFHTDSRDLHGRIHGFGSESVMARQLGNTDAGPSTRFSSMDDMPMSSMDMDMESSLRESSFLNGVGKAVNNITDFIRHKRGGDDTADKERKRMLDYIGELEWKLSQKDKEVQSWKERAERLQLRVNRFQGVQTGDTEEEDSDAEEDDDSDQDELKSQQSSLLEFDEGQADEGNVEKVEDTTAKEGTLVDVTPKPQVLNPPADPANEKKTKGDVDHDLHETLETAASAFSAQDGDEEPPQTSKREATEHQQDSLVDSVPSSRACQSRTRRTQLRFQFANVGQ